MQQKGQHFMRGKLYKLLPLGRQTKKHAKKSQVTRGKGFKSAGMFNFWKISQISFWSDVLSVNTAWETVAEKSLFTVASK